MTAPNESRRTFLKAAGSSVLAAGLPLDGSLLDGLRAAMASMLFGLPPADESMWPFTIEFDGALFTVYQPQPEQLASARLTGRAAISVQPAGAETPMFGSVRFEAELDIDNEEKVYAVRKVVISDVTLPKADDATKQLTKQVLEEGFSNFEGSFDLESLLDTLEGAEPVGSQDLATAPPKILTAASPAMLVTIDGEPKLAPAEDGSRVQRVVNTPFTILQDPESKAFYLKGDEWWYVADAPTGPWTETEGVPDAVLAVVPPVPDELEVEAKDAKAASLEGDARPTARPSAPKVVVSTEPAELIWTDGAVAWKPVPDTKLQYAANSSGYVVKDTNGQLYTVLSGRWYTGPSLEGPWSYVPSDALPAEFRKIPKDADVAGVLPFVAGTDEAQAAVASQHVPTTAEVKKGATTRVNWAGDPQFNDITGTSMRASENAGTPVIKVGSEYYACQNGVWYVGSEPNGTYTVATAVAPEIYKIPPQHPFYFTTFVRVFGESDDLVYTGYYPGYKGSYQLGATVVNGTGYDYPTTVVNNVYIRQPAPPTWGFGMTYNPWTGWSMGLNMGFGVGAGWFVFSLGGRPYGPYGPYSPWWGPAGWYPWWRPPYYAGFRPPYGYYRPVYRPPYVPVYRPGGNWNRPGYAGRPGGGYYGGYQPSNRPRPKPAPGGISNNIYNRPANKDRVKPMNRPNAKPAGRPAVTLPSVNGKPAARPAPQPGKPQTRPATRPTQNNVYADKAGNVWRETPNGWQQNKDGKWTTPTARPSPGTLPTTRPSPGTQPTTRPSTGAKPVSPSTRPATRPAPSPDLGSAAAARNRSMNRNPGGPAMAGNRSRPAPRPAPTSRPAPQRSTGGGRRR